MSFNGGGLSVTNDVTLDDSNRGVTLLASGGLSPYTTDPGGYTNGTPDALRRYEGGCTFRPESNNVILTVTCPITGPGTLIKNGDGLLVLGGANTYTGQTEIVKGTLEPVTAGALGTGPLLLKAQGRLLRRYPGPALPNGVELGGPITFEPGAAVVIEPDAGYSVPGNFTLPLFTLPTSVSIDPALVPVRHGLQNYSATVITTDAGGGRSLFSVVMVFQGTVMTIR